MAVRDRARKTKVKYRNNKMKTYGIYVAVVLMFLIGFFGAISYANQYKQEVQVLTVNKPIVDGSLIEESFLSPLTLPERGYQDGMVLWEDREQYIGKYAAYFLRQNNPVFTDAFTEEQPLRTPYLYNLDSDQELLTFPYNIAEAGGKLVTPGDRLRIRGSYNELGDPEDDSDDQIVADIIFDVVEVQDLLNSSNESIVDIINEANRLPQADRELLMTSDQFLNKITPRAILMVVNTEEIDKYVEFQANENPVYTITMLSRNEALKSNDLNTGNTLWNLLDQMKQNQDVIDAE